MRCLLEYSDGTKKIVIAGKTSEAHRLNRHKMTKKNGKYTPIIEVTTISESDIVRRRRR